MKILNMIIEIITSPLSFLFHANIPTFNPNKTCKPVLIFAIALVITVALALLFYSTYIF